MSRRREHCPRPGYGSGLRTRAYCGRTAVLGTGDHAQVLRRWDRVVRDPSAVTDECRECLRLRAQATS